MVGRAVPETLGCMKYYFPNEVERSTNLFAAFLQLNKYPVIRRSPMALVILVEWRAKLVNDRDCKQIS